MKRMELAAVLVLLSGIVSGLEAQQEGPVTTQALIRAQSEKKPLMGAESLILKVDDRETPVTSLIPVPAAGMQVALLIDDGLSRSAGIQLQDLKAFALGLPPATELLVGYMTNGRVETVVPFTTDHAGAAAKLRLPMSVPGVSASPYFCLSEFVKHWPGVDAEGNAGARKARFVMMITNGVDPYNGSVSIMNQDSPYVSAAIADAQRAGAAVSSIYYRDAAYGSGAAAVSGQSYLLELANATGGESYYQGLVDAVSLAPFLKEYTRDLSETYVMSFKAKANGGGRDHLVRLKVESTPKLKIRHPDAVRPGTVEVQ